MSNRPTLGFNIAGAKNQLKRYQFNSGRTKKPATREQYEAVWHAKEGSRTLTLPHLVCYVCYCRTLTYATPSLLPMLLLLFLEKLEGHFDQFYPKPKLLGPHSQHSHFVAANFGPTGICRATKLVPA